ncbi:Sterol uptake control protein [Lachnellula occidentalis]|uniref:Sterol uptake control protein n=1 Tax=Lachnellula occidentalis TaxID=215460 RepID=A0A8H8U8V9_9HELO|nr:Sterol uptake control protein [Lachnellula occidentalis]
MSPKPDSGLISQRRPHRKSRNGCQQCKKRKIKCDENKPSCGHCSRFSSPCSFSEALPERSSTANIRVLSPLSPKSPASLVLSGDFENSFFPSPGYITPPVALGEIHQGIGNQAFGVMDLELLHFFLTETCLTISECPDRQRLWQHVIPQIAFTHHFLIRGILSFAALHLAHTQPERRESLWLEASSHYDVGVGLFNIEVLNITPFNCDACFAFSTLLAAHAWPFSHRTSDLFFSTSPTAEQAFSTTWASLLRGVHALLDTAWDWIANGPLEPLLEPLAMDPAIVRKANPEISAKLTGLSQLWDPPPTRYNSADIEALSESLVLIQEACGILTSSTSERPVSAISLALAWPTYIPATFLELVDRLEPEALIILAHYSLILNQVDGVWFMHGMSRQLLQTIHERVGKDWESWMAWPLQDLALSELKNHLDDGPALSTLLFP